MFGLPSRFCVTISRQRSFDELGCALFDVPFCVVDLETTGGSAADCEITEIGAVRYRNGQVVAELQTLVDPGAAIPAFITVLTGITQAMVIQAPPIAEVYPAFLEFLGESVVVGHNIRFDLSFLNAAGERLGYGRLPNRSCDTRRLAERLIQGEVRNLRLSSLAKYFRSPVTPNHRALDDAKATAHVFWGLLERAGALGITHLEDLLLLPTARGATHYPKIRLADALPRRPGVYLFTDRDGTVFYVGKAKNLRSRVRSYFYGDGRRRTATMLKELAGVQYRECAGELEAEVTELRLICANRPRHNRRSRPPKSPTWLRLTPEKFPRLSLARRRHQDGSLQLGPFRSRRAAEQVMFAIWDAVPIRRCRGRPGASRGRCAAAKVGRAACPCAGDLDPADHTEAVDHLRAGITADPALLLDPLQRRMERLAAEQRFEEAARARDRYRSLARALRRRRRWQAMQRAGFIWFRTETGETVLVERGRLVAAWKGDTPPLVASLQPEAESPYCAVASSVEDAEEADLIWKWLARSVLLDVSGELSLPPRPVPEPVPLGPSVLRQLPRS